MGLIIDTGVLIRIEREPAAVDFSRYKPAYGEGFVSAATCSELLVGVHLANTEQRRARRSAFVEAVFRLFPPADAELVIHANAPLTGAVALQKLEPVRGRCAQCPVAIMQRLAFCLQSLAQR